MKCVKLNQLCEINIGKTPSRSNSKYWGKGHKWLSIADMKSKYISETKEEITDLAVSEANMKIVPKNTVLMSFKLSIGKIGITTEEMYTNEAIASFPIIEKEKIISEYLYYVLKTLRYDNLSDRAVMGATLNKKKLNQIVIPLPSIIVQKKIVNLLNKAEELIDKRKAQIEALDQLTQSVFLEMFGDPVTNPNGWEIVNLQDIADYFIGLTYKPNDVSDEGIVVLRSSNIQNGVIDLNDIVRVKKEVNDKLLVKQNDILMCSRNGSARLVGKVALIPELEERMTFGAFMTIIRSRYYCYLYNYFQSSAFRRQITSGATTTINQITKKMLNYVKLPLPPTSLQNEFAHKVEQIQHQKEILQTSLLELENMYNSLMQKAFKGELFTEEKVSNL